MKSWIWMIGLAVVSLGFGALCVWMGSAMQQV